MSELRQSRRLSDILGIGFTAESGRIAALQRLVETGHLRTRAPQHWAP
jgi:hypothetical protein